MCLAGKFARNPFTGENDVEYAEFSMAQGLMVREPSPAVTKAAAAANRLKNRSSFEEKLMLFQLFDRHDRTTPSMLNSGPSSSNQTGTSEGESMNLLVVI